MPLPEVFAGCTGRFSAELEHAWLLRDPKADLLEARRARFEQMLAAISLADRRSHLLAHRISAKIVHAQILSTAQFSRDPHRARWARRRADAEIRYCQSFLLES
ncbi:hypothetical protein [Roseovarius sp. THAF9]|uniref:hypothetical protein n=1 Tax=Roseovarius sp. THAF9 TaxID=2587847 RepID=UPI00156252AA|nr:hypothetical protein [Roseovarius sp. THAF9]